MPGSLPPLPAAISFSSWRVHNWPAFWTVVCLGLVQVVVTYYASALTIDGLPAHVPESRKRRHKRIFGTLFAVFMSLTLFLAKLNDSNQYKAQLLVDQERSKQTALQMQLQQTLDTVLDSQQKLEGIRQTVNAHAPGAERSSMLDSIGHIENNLRRQQSMLRAGRQ